MTVGVMVETIYQRVQGMKPSIDSSVKRVDIRAYLPAAINYAMNQQYYLNIQTDKDTGALPKLFVATYEDVEVKKSESRDLRYFDLPASPIALPNDNGIESVSAMQGAVSFYPMKTQHQLSGYERFVGGNVGYWIEGRKVFLSGASPVLGRVLVRMTASVEDLDSDDRVPVPAGMEVSIIDICVQHFTGARSMPQDNKQNNVDDLNRGIEK
jgi:hypothetical protein